MNRHEFLGRLHAVLAPRGYLEIGVHDGRSLALSRVPTVAIDPVNVVTEEIRCDLEFVEATSDDALTRHDPMRHLPGRNIDLAFIDGMHLFEFALRDFINVEKLSHPGTVVLFDDMLPRKDVEALRHRKTKAWTGDVYKIIPVLARYRPDLLCIPMDTKPTGVMLVFGADASNRVLNEAYDEIVAEWVTEDPQTVPAEILGRTMAHDPEAVLEADLWSSIIAMRTRRRSLRRRGPRRVVRTVQHSLGGHPPRGRISAIRKVLKPRTRVRRLVRRLRRRFVGRS